MPAGRSARIGAGATWEPVLAATAPHGLAALCGSAPGVGVAGYLLGGGLGPLARSYGFSADHIEAVEVVTPADGRLIVTAESDPDLFWALRGGKGGLGVVTAVTIGLLPLAEVYGGALYFGAADVPAVLAAYAEWSPALPESTTASIALLRLPEADALPDAIRGRTVAHVRVASIDAPAKAERHLAALRAVAKPVLDTIGRLPYDRIGTIHADPVTPMPVANGSATLATLDAGAVAALLAAAGPGTDAPLASVEVRTLGGAAARPAAVPNAVGGRGAAPRPQRLRGTRSRAERRRTPGGRSVRTGTPGPVARTGRADQLRRPRERRRHGAAFVVPRGQRPARRDPSPARPGGHVPVRAARDAGSSSACWPA